MSLELLDHCFRIIEANCVKNCFDFWFCFRSDAFDLVLHYKFGVDQGAQQLKSVANAIRSMQYTEMLLASIAGDSLPRTPQMDVTL